MEFDYAYHRDSLVRNEPARTDMSFSPDTLRQPTWFRGELRQGIAFREAMGALHDVVISDLRWKPKDRAAYLAWAEQQEEIDFALIAARKSELAAKIEPIRSELDGLRSRERDRNREWDKSVARYFRHILVRDHAAWLVLDPVITVHPDQVFFECFSKDESSYGRLAVGYDTFKNVGEFSCGTTNVDYSNALYDEFQRIRSYKTTRLEIDPSGFEVETTGSESHKEVKIDVPDSWVRGFLQVSSAATLPVEMVELHPMDVHNICFVLRRRRELRGPRSLRWLLRTGQPARVIIDPWNLELECPRSICQGDCEDEIRIWGRRRLHVLERLLPVARKFTLRLLGRGMPSFWSADLGDMTFTLGLSGWTVNDWSSSANFDLLAPRADVDQGTRERVFAALGQHWFASADDLARELELDRAAVLGALASWTQAGRAIHDIDRGVYRLRELSREPLPIDRLRFHSEREQKALERVDGGGVRVTRSFLTPEAVLVLEGEVRTDHRTRSASMKIDADERIVEADCSCNFHAQNRLRKGPCEHLLALRLQYARTETRRVVARK